MNKKTPQLIRIAVFLNGVLDSRVIEFEQGLLSKYHSVSATS